MFKQGDVSCPSDVYEHQGKYYLPVIPSHNISRANGGQGKLKGTTIWDAVRIIQHDDGPYLGKESILPCHMTAVHGIINRPRSFQPPVFLLQM